MAFAGPTRPDSTRSNADCDRRPKTSATFCWAMTGSIAYTRNGHLASTYCSNAWKAASETSGSNRLRCLKLLLVEGRNLIGHVVFQPAVHARGLDSQGEGEDVLDSLALLAQLVRRQDGLPAGPLDPGVVGAGDLHLGDPREVSAGDPVTKFFERIGAGREPDGRRGRRRLLEEVIRRLQLASHPFRDPRGPVVRLVAEVLGELMLGLFTEQLNVLPARKIARYPRTRPARTSPAPGPEVRSPSLVALAADRLRQVVDGLIDHGIPKGARAACAWS